MGFNGGLNLFLYAGGNPITNEDPLGLKIVDGMECTLVSREPIPSINSSAPDFTYRTEVVICTKVEIQDTYTCACVGKPTYEIRKYYGMDQAYLAVYRCGIGSCDSKNYITIKKIETDYLGLDKKVKYENIPGRTKVITTGHVMDSMSTCSACIDGVGKPMPSKSPFPNPF